MKRFVQIALIVILVCVLFQSATNGSMASGSKVGSKPSSDVHLSQETDSDNAYVAGCLISIKGVICVRPNVGWNT